MKVYWFGMDDSQSCVLAWHELRLELRDKHDVTLMGPGYSWAPGAKVKLSEILKEFGTPDVLVVDDANGMGYVPMAWDAHPNCKVVYREHDWHNRHRREMLQHTCPDLVMATVDRPYKQGDVAQAMYRMAIVPHPVNVHRFHPDGRGRKWNVGIYGKTGHCYDARGRAYKVLRQRSVDRVDVWVGQHGGYWRDGRGSLPGKTFYNDELAEALRDVKILWVDGSDHNVMVMKYFEAAASGCAMIGVRPYGWQNQFPVEPHWCQPEEINDIVDYLLNRPEEVAEETTAIREWCEKNHSIEARAAMISDLLWGVA